MLWGRACLRMGFAGGCGVGGKSALSPALSLKGEGAVLSRRKIWSHPETPHSPSSFPRTREPSCLGLGVSAPLRVCPTVLFRPLGRVPFVKRHKRNQKGLPRHTGPTESGYPREFPRHGGPPRGYVPVARGALATSMSHDLLSAGFARPSEGAFGVRGGFSGSPKSQSRAALLFVGASLLANPTTRHWVPAFAGMTRVEDGA